MARMTGARSLWEFALALYSSPGVEETVLHLQDEQGANVNILLWTFWLESRGIPLSLPLLARAEAAIEDWDTQVVAALRHLRRQLKAPAEREPFARDIRSRIKEAELLAERRCLGLLESLELPRSTHAPRPGENATVYLRHLGVQADCTALLTAARRVGANS